MVIAVDDVENDVGVLFQDMAADIKLFGGVGGEGVGAGEVDEVEGVSVVGEGADLFVDGDAAIVADALVGVGGDVEDAGLAAVGVADEGDVDGLGAFVGNVLYGGDVGIFQGAVVVVVGDFLLGLLLGDNLHLHGVAATEGDLEVEDTVFDRVVEGGVEDGLDGDALDESHLDYTLTEGAVARNAHHDTTFSSL